MIVVSGAGPMRWVAVAEGQEVGSLAARVRPDGRCFLFHRGGAGTRGLLVEAALRARQGELYVEVDEADADAVDLLRACGFTEHRREHHYLLPTDPARTGLAPDRPLAGFRFLHVAEADVDRWRELDDALRQDVPGTAGWCNDPQRFAAETFDDPEFDPATYLLAVDEGDGRYVGLVRVWRTAAGPRLGLIGTRAGHRRRGIAAALLAEVLGVLHGRGETRVGCEVDATNTASNALMTGLGAERVGGAVELLRR